MITTEVVPSNLSCGKAYVLIHGCRVAIVGRICMDQLMVDVTELPDVKQGDTATLIGKDGSAEITAEQAAANAGTIANEVLRRGWEAAWKGFFITVKK